MKKDHIITCPQCQHSFSAEGAFASQLRGRIEAEVRSSYDVRFARERDTLTRELTQAAKAEAARSQAARVAELETAAIERDAALKRTQAQLETTRREATKRAHEEFQAERGALEDEMQRIYSTSQAAREEFQTQLGVFDEQLQIQRDDLELSRSTELKLRSEKARLEGARQELEVELARKLDDERSRMQAEVARNLETERVRVREEYAAAHAQAQSLGEAEHAQQNEALRRQVEDLHRKLEAGGEQRRGEVCEVRLETALRAAFPADTIEAVGRGINGADVRQRVCPPGQRPCGIILYESKHTAKWSPSWTTKLRDDQRADRADVAVIVSAALPKDVATFALVDGVWVTSFACLPSLALALRIGLLQVAAHRQAMIGREEKMEVVYAFMTGDHFRRIIESLMATFLAMGEDLQKEKRALATMWRRRENQLERLTASITTLAAELQTIAGTNVIPELAPLELDVLLDEGNHAASSGRQSRQEMLM